MKTEYKYIHFAKTADKPKTSVWSCYNKKSGDLLCQVKWYSGWRQYCSMPMVQAVYSAGCHDDISDFLEQLNQERRNK